MKQGEAQFFKSDFRVRIFAHSCLNFLGHIYLELIEDIYYFPSKLVVINEFKMSFSNRPLKFTTTVLLLLAISPIFSLGIEPALA